MAADTFKDKVAIVTGAASGIGKALSGELARRGAVVVMADLNASQLQEAAAAMEREGGRIRPVVLDVTDFEAVKRAVDDTAAMHGHLDYLFNNAGIGILSDVRDRRYDFWRRVIDTNLYGVVNGVAAAYPVMVRQEFGHIVNTASLAGLVPFPGEVSYTTSKYGIVGLSHALRVEGADLGVKVNVVCPGLIQTPIIHTSEMVNIDRDRVLALLPKRLMAPEKCARVILRGVEKNRATIVVTATAKFLWFLQRTIPSFVHWILKRGMRKFRQLRLNR